MQPQQRLDLMQAKRPASDQGAEFNYGDSAVILQKCLPAAKNRAMGGPARTVIPGIPHHVTQRGNGRAQTFFSASTMTLYEASVVKSSVPQHFSASSIVDGAPRRNGILHCGVQGGIAARNGICPVSV